jgi:erythronate-4-phosphate dehydrogenase
MKIVVDENISFAEEAFSTMGDVQLSHGREITNEMLRDADALIVRSIANVNEELLSNTPVRFVGTATIGTDHIDKNYLQQNGITFADAAGCNSHAVKEYVFAAIFNLCVKHNISLVGKSIGIIGCGNIGSKVAEVAESLGLKVYKNDPPLQRAGNSNKFCSLDEALECDIVTCHVPLNKGGKDNTVHLIDEDKLKIIRPGAILINSSRGPVIDNKALKQKLMKHIDLHVVLDVWENEPDFDVELLKLIDIGSAHIAGYSLEGKVNGTTLVYNALCNHLDISPKWAPKLPEVENSLIKVDHCASTEEFYFKLFNQVYPISEDDLLMRETLSMEETEVGSHFDNLRKTYRLRRELNNYKLVPNIFTIRFSEPLKLLRLNFTST